MKPSRFQSWRISPFLDPAWPGNKVRSAVSSHHRFAGYRLTLCLSLCCDFWSSVKKLRFQNCNSCLFRHLSVILNFFSQCLCYRLTVTALIDVDIGTYSLKSARANIYTGRDYILQWYYRCFLKYVVWYIDTRCVHWQYRLRKVICCLSWE